MFPLDICAWGGAYIYLWTHTRWFVRILIMRGLLLEVVSMMEKLVQNILEPILLRLGSMLAGALVGLGLATQHGPSVQSLVVALGLLAAELVLRQLRRRP